MAEEGPAIAQAAMLLEGAAAPALLLRGDDLVIEWTNRVLRELTGDAALAGQRYEEAFPHLAGSPLAASVRRALTAGEAARATAVRFDADESPEQPPCVYDVLVQPLHDSPSRVLVLGLDVTERYRREEAVRFVAEAGRLLFSSLDFETTLGTLADLTVPRLADWCAIEIVREDGSSEQLAVAHSDPAKIAFARELRERYPPDPTSPHGLPQVLRTGEPEIYREVPEELIRASARDEEHLRISLELGLRSALLVPLVARGRVLGAITLVYAESGRRYDDLDLEIAQEIASRAANAVDNARLYGEAQAAIRVRDDFLSVASHELRTPLTSMHLLVGGVLRKLDRGDENVDEQRLRRLDGQLFRLASLIDQLLDVSRLNAGRFVLHPERTRLGDLLDEVVDRFRDEASARGVTLSLDGADSVEGEWDPQRLDQVFTNLIGNAIKYGGGSPVSVRARPQEGTVRVLVEDHGPGIAEEDLERIFERFERAASSRKHGGMGLGLWIARQMVEAHGGSLSARSVAGEGATFIVELPVLSREGHA